MEIQTIINAMVAILLVQIALEEVPHNAKFVQMQWPIISFNKVKVPVFKIVLVVIMKSWLVYNAVLAQTIALLVIHLVAIAHHVDQASFYLVEHV